MFFIEFDQLFAYVFTTYEFHMMMISSTPIFSSSVLLSLSLSPRICMREWLSPRHLALLSVIVFRSCPFFSSLLFSSLSFGDLNFLLLFKRSTMCRVQRPHIQIKNRLSYLSSLAFNEQKTRFLFQSNEEAKCHENISVYNRWLFRLRSYQILTFVTSSNLPPLSLFNSSDLQHCL